MSSKHPHVVISHVYSSDNKGDAALTGVLIDGLRARMSGARITLLKLEDVRQPSDFADVTEQPSFMYHAVNRYRHPIIKLLYTMYMMSATFLWAVIMRLTKYDAYLPQHLRQVARTYAAADLIVPVGGGYLRSRKGLLNRMNVPLLLHPLLFAWLLGKPTVLFSQSVGPFQNWFERYLTRAVLRRMTLVLVREDTSLQLLHQIGVRRNARRAVDAGFLLADTQQVDIEHEFNIPGDRLRIGVTVRSWLTGAEQERYERAVALALDRFIGATNAYALFIPQVTATKGDDDRIASRRVFEYMQRKDSALVVEDVGDYRHIKTLYNALDLLLGTRFHSVIFSLTSYVPVLAIEYEHKTSGIMRDLGIEDWSIKIEDVTADGLTARLEALLARQGSYRRHLQRTIPAYVAKAELAIEATAGVLQGRNTPAVER